jgi:hypothetical protein
VAWASRPSVFFNSDYRQERKQEIASHAFPGVLCVLGDLCGSST